ncbi:MAG: Hsp20/alpha crystallin family protein [Neobacillus sp.]
MNSKKDEESVDYDQMEKWLENYFLDPLTTFNDQSQFRIDLYETAKEWIVEAILTDFTSSEITVFIEEKELTITAVKHPLSYHKKKVRTIAFPFQIINQKVTATFKNGILEVFISKSEKDLKKNRFITLP